MVAAEGSDTEEKYQKLKGSLSKTDGFETKFKAHI
jgi:hypothetical protein